MDRIGIRELLDRYEVLLLDAYGVLVDTGGPLPGAARLIDECRRRQRRILLLSNDASRLPSTTLARYRGFGLHLAEHEVLTSGMLLRGYFEEEHLAGRRCLVLGTEDSEAYVREAGGVIAELGAYDADVVVVADDEGYPFLEGIERTLTAVIHRVDRAQPVHLVLPNPDLIYPKGPGDFGLASGSVARLIEGGLRVRYGAKAPRFVGLGKPYPRIFAEAMRRLGRSERVGVVMVGDQLQTDVLGAADFGIASALTNTGLTHIDRAALDPQPTHLLELDPRA